MATNMALHHCSPNHLLYNRHFLPRLPHRLHQLLSTRAHSLPSRKMASIHRHHIHQPGVRPLQPHHHRIPRHRRPHHPEIAIRRRLYLHNSILPVLASALIFHTGKTSRQLHGPSPCPTLPKLHLPRLYDKLCVQSPRSS